MYAAPYEPDKINWQELLSPQAGTGKFIGIPFQRGNGLGSILRVIRHYVPLVARSALGQELGKQVTNIASDINTGVTPIDSIKTRAREGLRNLTGLGKRKRHTKHLRGHKRSVFVPAL